MNSLNNYYKYYIYNLILLLDVNLFDYIYLFFKNVYNLQVFYIYIIIILLLFQMSLFNKFKLNI